MIVLIIVNISIVIFCFVSLDNISKKEEVPNYEVIPNNDYADYLSKKKKKLLVEEKKLHNSLVFNGFLYAREINDLYEYYYVDELGENTVLSKIIKTGFNFGKNENGFQVHLPGFLKNHD